MYAILHQFLMTLPTGFLSTINSDFLKRMIILKLFISVILHKTRVTAAKKEIASQTVLKYVFEDIMTKY